MSEDVAATPSNFSAHLASVEMPEPSGFESSGDSGGDTSAPASPGGRSGASEDYIERRAQQRQAAAPDEPDEAPEPELEEQLETGEPDFDGDEPPPEEQPEEQEQQGDAPSHEQLMEMHQALQSTHLPEQLMDRMMRVSDGEREWDVPISEMRNGYMRANRFSRGMQEQARTIQEARGMVENLRHNFQTWKQNPEAFVTGMRRLIGDQAFDKAVELRAVQMYQLNKLPKEFREMHIENERLKAEQEQLRQMQEQRQRQPDPYQQQQAMQQAQTYLEQQIVPAVFERHGITRNKASENLFGQHMMATWDRRPETWEAALDDAAAATYADLKQYAEEHLMAQAEQHQGRNGARMLKQATAQRPPQIPRPALSPRSLPGAAPKAGERNRRGTRAGGGSASDFASFRRALNGG